MRRGVEIGRLVGDPLQEGTKRSLFPEQRQVAADTRQLRRFEQGVNGAMADRMERNGRAAAFAPRDRVVPLDADEYR